MKVGFIGAGRMGSPMVKRLSRAGDSVRVLVRSAEFRASIGADLGAEPVGELAELTSGAEAVVICVHNDKQVRDICIDQGLLKKLEPGSTLIVHTTGNPFLVREFAAVVASRNISVVDAPVSGGPDDIDAGKITIYAGGDAGAFESASRVLSKYADPLVHAGPLGAGQAVKLVNNAIFLSNIEILTAGISFGKQLGVEESMLVDCLQRGSARSFALESVARVGSSAGFRSVVGEFLDKDLIVVRDVANSTTAELGALGKLLGSGTTANAAGV